MSGVFCQLTGEDGNAGAVMGRVTDALKKAKVERNIITSYREKALLSDYDNLLRVSMDFLDEAGIEYE